jgi:hypothetical protein
LVLQISCYFFNPLFCQIGGFFPDESATTAQPRIHVEFLNI